MQRNPATGADKTGTASKATGSRSSTQRLSYALPARDLVGAGTGVLFFPRCGTCTTMHDEEGRWTKTHGMPMGFSRC
jgi:hypothetical protein